MYKKVVIAALLHDIGKLIQRANGEQVYHGKVGADYLKQFGFDEEIIASVYCHHSKVLKNRKNLCNPELVYLVYQADNLASEHDRRENILSDDESEMWDKDAALKTVFSYLNKNSEKEYVYPARDLNPNKKIMYPLVKKEIYATQDKYQLLKKIIDDNLDKDISPNSLLELLESVMTYVTSSTNTKENIDISLFDHSKMTAAIAACLYSYFEENNITEYKENLVTNVKKDEKYYLLVSGDISGIQDFIYTISSKGALKSLRARSFYLELMLEHIADEILSELNLYRCNLLYTGGGHFYMLLPNTEKTKKILEIAQNKINEWFINEYGNGLYIAIASEEASSNDLLNTKRIFRNVSINLSKKKLSRYNKSQLKKLITPVKNVAAGECVICSSSSKKTDLHSFIDSELEVCDTCYNLFKIGENIVKDNMMFVVSSSNSPQALEFPSISENKKYLSLTLKDIPNDTQRIYVLNDRKIGNNYATKLFMGNYVCKIGDKIANFEDLASKNVGINRLAVLRCDVDNLGQTFVNGFSDKYSTLSRTTSLSRQLSLFFKFYINNICNSDLSGEAGERVDNFSLNDKKIEDKKNLSIVYSGGDDLFIVGAWLDVLNFAFDLREAFKKYTCNKLTFSGGLGFFYSGYPISQMAAIVAGLEEAAKKYDNDTKDSISLFGKSDNRCDTYHWDEFKSAVYEKISLLSDVCNFDETHVDKNKVLFSTSMRYKFKQLLTSVSSDEDEKSGRDCSLNLARFAYTLARMKPGIKDLSNKVLEKNWIKFKTNIYNWSQSDRKSLLTALDLIIYLNRKGGKDELWPTKS